MGEQGLSGGVKVGLALSMASVLICCMAAMFVGSAASELKAQFKVEAETSLSRLAVQLSPSLRDTQADTFIAERQAPIVTSTALDEALSDKIGQAGWVSALVVGPDNVILAKTNFPELSRGSLASQGVIEAVLQERLASLNASPVNHLGSGPITSSRSNTLTFQVFSAPIHSSPDGVTTYVGARLVGVMNSQSLTYTLNTLWNSLALLAASLCGLIGLAWLGVHRWFSVPLNRMSDGVETASATGHFSSVFKEFQSKDVARLSSALSDFFRKVRSRELHLERRVRQRSDELKRLSEDLKFRALHDPLTGLPNRSMLEDDITRAAASSDRKGHYFAVLMMDLDDFKRVNDSFGHDFGDELLKQLASRLQNNLRGEDRVYRYGGDEFVAIVEGLVTALDVEAIAKTVLREMCNHVRLRGEEISVSVSIGASVYPKHGRTLSELIHNADCAMYAAKEQGKNTFVLYSDEIEDNESHTDWIIKELPKAMSNNELLVYYQPNVKVENGVFKIVGAEALVRWRHPVKGVIMPQEFVGHAEEYSLITQLDFYVLHSACMQARTWYERGIPIPVAVNLCAEHFKSYQVVERIKSLLEEIELPPYLLCLELRDSRDLRDSYEAHHIMASLHELGVKIALDNYGVGATSINYLRKIPLDYLKLDKSIVRDVNLSEKDKNLIKGMVDLAKDLKIGLVAEGVEDEVQVESLAGIGCDTMQGFYFCEPRDLAGFVQWVQESTRH